jgi:hypothetical protein
LQGADHVGSIGPRYLVIVFALVVVAVGNIH